MAFQKSLSVKCVASHGLQLNLFAKMSSTFRQNFINQFILRARNQNTRWVFINAAHARVYQIISASKGFADADRPHHGHNGQGQAFFDFIQQGQRLLRFAVKFIDEGNDGNVT